MLGTICDGTSGITAIKAPVMNTIGGETVNFMPDAQGRMTASIWLIEIDTPAKSGRIALCL